MMRSIHTRLAAFAAFVIAAPLAAQIAPDHLVDQISEAEYHDVLRNKLFTRMGHNRGYGWEHDPCRDFLLSSYQSFGLDVYLHPFQVVGRTWYNVIATLPGEVRPDEQYIVIAHFDTVNNPGADDNGTGTAAILEIARILSNYRFDSTIIFFASDREEDGMRGSWAYASERRDDNIIGVVNIDMIGWNPEGDSARIYGQPISDPVKQQLADALDRYVGVQAVIEGELNRSDHFPFEQNGKPAAFLIERYWDQNVHYHRQTDSTDTPNYIDYEHATRLTRGVAGWLVEQAGLLPTYLPETFEVVRGEHASGGLPELENNDDVYFEIDAVRPFKVSAPSAAIEVEAVAATRQIDAITLAVECRASGLPTMQGVELYNFTQGRWVTIDERLAGPADQAIYIEVTTNPRQFIEQGTRRMRARISAYDHGVPFVGWGVHIDRINWIVE